MTTTTQRSILMKPQSTFSPISLRYIAALRGNRPKKTGTAFTYAEAACADAEKLICLAASNPDGRFFGLVGDETARRAAEEKAAQRGTFNIAFLVGTPSAILANLDKGASLPPMLDYLCCDTSAAPLPEAEKKALFDLAHKRLNPGGLFTMSYAAYDRDDGALRFLVREAAPEMNPDQKREFLSEIKRLGGSFLSRHPDIAARLQEATIKGEPEKFFTFFDGDKATSNTFDMIVAMRSRGMAYAGDAALTSNYVELAVPVAAQALVVSCRENHLYEPIKDLALDRKTRSDIWIKTPAAQSMNAAELFGGFAYGIVMPRDQVPTSFAAQGKTIDLSSPLYIGLIDLMATMPIGVGDVLTHAAGRDQKPEKILEALQILVACGIATPMRGQHHAAHTAGVAQPRLVGNFNRFIDKTDLGDKDVWLSSEVMGCGIAVSARDALVMQALNRAGLSNSVSALMPELRRISGTAAGQSLIKAAEPTAEMAHELIVDVVGKSLPQWYAYALLEAA